MIACFRHKEIHKIMTRLKWIAGALVLAAMVSTPLMAQVNNPKLTKQEAANLKLVEDWWKTVLVAHHIDQMTKFADENMIQHNPNAPNGLEPLRKIFGSRPATEIPASITPPPALELSQGDVVTIIFDHEAKDPADPSKTYHYNSFDAFRIKDNKIVEHWDGAQKAGGRQAKE
jgi:predicted SnoaL-like aldol condensation-catalyzing enzyme